jgi:hypothetical protein
VARWCFEGRWDGSLAGMVDGGGGDGGGGDGGGGDGGV